MEQNEEYKEKLKALKIKGKRQFLTDFHGSMLNIELRSRKGNFLKHGRIAYDFNSGIINPVLFKNFKGINYPID